MVAEGWGVTVLMTMISSESGKCGVGLAALVNAGFVGSVGAGGAVRVGGAVGLTVWAGAAGVGDAGRKEPPGRKTRKATSPRASPAPVIHQPASTRWRR